MTVGMVEEEPSRADILENIEEGSLQGDPEEDDEDAVHRYNIGLSPGNETASQTVQSTALDIQQELNLGDVRDVITGEFTRREAENLRSLSGVDYVERDGYFLPLSSDNGSVSDVSPASSDDSYPWGLGRIGALDAHDDGYKGDGADIVIIDTGVDPTHEALADNVGTGNSWDSGDPITAGPSDCTEDDRRYVDVNCETDWDDDQFHGTHVAGSAGAVDRSIDSDDVGGQYSTPNTVTRIAGVAPEATIHSAAVFEWIYDSDNDIWAQVAPHANTADAIKWAADSDYDVANASLGGDTSASVIEDALDYATNENNLIFVAAAGNDGNDCSDDDCIGYPAAFDAAIAVANSTVSDDIADSSSRGPEVDVAAPGSSIMSTFPPHQGPDGDPRDDFMGSEHGYLYFPIDGTSMAAPHVAGLAALLKAHTPLEDNDEIRSTIENTTEDIGEDEVEQGEGLVDVMAALDEAAGADETTLDLNLPDSIGQGESATLDIDAALVDSVTVEKLWIDWGVDWDEPAENVDDDVEALGKLEFSWETTQNTVTLTPTITPNEDVSPDPKYVGGEFRLDVTADGPEETIQDSVTLEIDG